MVLRILYGTGVRKTGREGYGYAADDHEDVDGMGSASDMILRVIIIPGTPETFPVDHALTHTTQPYCEAGWDGMGKSPRPVSLCRPSREGGSDWEGVKWKRV